MQWRKQLFKATLLICTVKKCPIKNLRITTSAYIRRNHEYRSHYHEINYRGSIVSDLSCLSYKHAFVCDNAHGRCNFDNNASRSSGARSALAKARARAREGKFSSRGPLFCSAQREMDRVAENSYRAGAYWTDTRPLAIKHSAGLHGDVPRNC